MLDPHALASILDSIESPILYADTDHRIRFMNKAAIAKYDEGAALLGRSLLACHNTASQAIILDALESFRAGETERLISTKPKERIFMRAVRDGGGTVIGYYERYEFLKDDGRREEPAT
jgi:DUF438 domain-containing protein